MGIGASIFLVAIGAIPPPTAPQSDGEMLVVVGAGIVGLGSAYELVRDGHDVTVVDADTVGAGASHGNAAKITRAPVSVVARWRFSSWVTLAAFSSRMSTIVTGTTTVRVSFRFAQQTVAPLERRGERALPRGRSADTHDLAVDFQEHPVRALDDAGFRDGRGSERGFH